MNTSGDYRTGQTNCWKQPMDCSDVPSRYLEMEVTLQVWQDPLPSNDSRTRGRFLR